MSYPHELSGSSSFSELQDVIIHNFFFLHLSAILQYSYHLLYNDHKDFLVIGKFDFASRLPIITDKNR